jgi:50S ribosomal subunit-associated GTPase HflX
MAEKPALHLFNKIDRIDADPLGDAIFVSAVAEGGLEPLRRALLSAVRARWPVMDVEMSVTDGRLLAEVHRSAHVL